MAAPVTAKYERILQADPRSRIFVELARALLEEGEAERAVVVCEQGLLHHPDSAQARLTMGRALLMLGRVDEAVARFEQAFSVDAATPYECDVAAEALIRHGHAGRALPLLRRAAATYPGDARIQRRLEEARLASPGVDEPSEPGVAAPPPMDESSVTVAGDALAPLVDPSTRNGRLDLPPDGRISPEAPAPTNAPPPLPPGVAQRAVALVSVTTLPVRLDAVPPLTADAPPPPTDAQTSVEQSRAAAAAQSYEQQLRERAQEPAPPRQRRRWAALALLALVVIPLLTWAAIRLARRAEPVADPRTAAERARNGLARDTRASLTEAARVLDRTADAATPANDALSAQLSALVAHDFGDVDARGVAAKLLAAGRAGDAAPVVRWLLAEDDHERAAAEAPLLAGAGGGVPLADAVGGEILLARGDLERARARLESAARASPPLLRAIGDLGDLELSRRDAAAAHDRYVLVLQVQPTHPRATLGEAEATLQLGGDVAETLRKLEALDRDRASVRQRDLLRLDLAMARVLAASSRTDEAQQRISAAARRAPGRPEVPAAEAEVAARKGDLEEALRAADVARRLAPEEPRYRALLARTQLRAGRYRELLASSEGATDRGARIYRGIAQLRLGKPEAARAELEATRRDGKMPPEAAAWAAAAELALGHRDQASTITNAVLATPSPPAIAFVVHGRIALAAADRDGAEQRLREAIRRDPELVEAQIELARLLLDTGRAPEARDLLQRGAVQRPWDLDLRLEVAKARLAAGDATGAVQDATAVVTARPAEADPLTVLSAAQLAAGDARAAWRSAERSYTIAPRSPAVALALARAAKAQGDENAARRLFGRAARLGRDGPEAREARAALAGMKRG